MSDILHFPIRNDNLVRSMRITRRPAYTRQIVREGKRGDYIVTLHFIGTQSEIRACEFWEVSMLPRAKTDPPGSFHVRCVQSSEAATADRIELVAGRIQFVMKTRCNQGGVAHGSPARRVPERVPQYA